MAKAAEICPCGQPLHYVNDHARYMVEQLIVRLGPTVRVTCKDRTWLVPRHYVALHGIKAWQLPTLGFPEVAVTNHEV